MNLGETFLRDLRSWVKNTFVEGISPKNALWTRWKGFFSRCKEKSGRSSVPVSLIFKVQKDFRRSKHLKWAYHRVQKACLVIFGNTNIIESLGPPGKVYAYRRVNFHRRLNFSR